MSEVNNPMEIIKLLEYSAQWHLSPKIKPYQKG